MVTRTQARANISRALSRVRASRGGTTGGVSGTARVKGFVQPRATFKDVSGKAVSIPLNGKSPQQVVAEHNKKVTAIAASQIRSEQRRKAISKIGAIRRVVQKGNEITYIGFGKRSFTFPKGGMTFTGKEKFGGVVSSEVALQKARQAGVKRNIAAIKSSMAKTKREKETRTALLGAQRDRQIQELQATKTPISKRQKVKISGFEKRVEKLTARQEGVQKRQKKFDETVTEIVRFIPGFKNVPTAEQFAISQLPALKKAKSYGQRLLVAALKLPNNLTIGFGEQAILVGGKITAAIEGLTRKDSRALVGKELVRAGKETPAAVGRSLDPRTPEGLIGLAAVALLTAKAGSARASVIAKKGSIKTTATKSGFSKGKVTVNQKGSFTNLRGKKVNFQINKAVTPKGRGTAVTTMKNARGQTILKTRARIKITKGTPQKLRQTTLRIRQIKKAPSKTKARRGVERQLAKELVRKLDTNKKAITARIKNAKLLRKQKARSLANRDIKKANSLRRTNKRIEKQLKDLGFGKGLKVRLRKEIRKDLRPLKKKIPKKEFTKLIKRPKGKRILKVRLKPKGRKLIRKISRPTKQRIIKLKANVKRSLTRTITRSDKISMVMTRKVIRVLNKLSDKLDTMTQFSRNQFIKVVNQFNRIKNPTVRQAQILINRLKVVVKKGRVVVKKGITKGGKVVRKGVKKISKFERRSNILLQRKINKVLSRARFQRVTKGITKRVTKPIEIRMIRLSKLLEKTLIKSKGKVNKSVKIIIKQMKKISPFEFKILKLSPKRPKGIKKIPTGRRATVRRFQRKRMTKLEEKIIVRQILKGKRKLTPQTPARIRKLVKKRMVEAAKKKEIGMKFKIIRKTRGRVLKSLRRKKEIATTIKRMAKRKGKRKIVRVKPSKPQMDQLRSDAQRRLKLLGIKDKTAANKINNLQKQLPKAIKKASQQSNTKQDTILIQKTKKVMNNQKVNKITKQIKKVSKSKSVKVKNQQSNSVQKSLRSGQQQLKLILKKPSLKPGIKRIALIQATIIGLLGNRLNIARATFERQRGGVIPIFKPDEKQKEEQTSKQTVVVDEVIEEEEIVVPDVRVDTLPDQQIRQIINQIFGSIVGTGALAGTALLLRTPTGFKGLKGATLQSQSFSGIKQSMFRFAKRKRFVFTPDLVAILFNQVASKSQARKLTKPGRVFTGLERRLIVKFSKRKK